MMNSVWTKNVCRLAVAALVVSTAQVGLGAMALVDPALPGNTQTDFWSLDRLSTVESSGYGSFPGFAAWPGAIASSTTDVGSDGDAGLVKVANGAGGGPFVSSGSIYHGGTTSTPNTLGGTLGVQDATPVAGVSNVVFQLQIGEAFGYDLFNGVLPVLNYNGGSQALVATNSELIGHEFAGTFPDPLGGPDLPIFTNTYLIQWDTTGLGATSLNVTFHGVQHSQVYQMQLNQSDVFQSVPEPSSVTLAGLAMLGAIGMVWKKRRSR
jgi:hypothetical protein